ncbi:hypothetical protein F5884DRAFT_665295 [Xylogone sp. PMI_703]|nr:hypothetical protein F5884DRAFT_665295 [Xylogone sp. PMI_703]
MYQIILALISLWLLQLATAVESPHVLEPLPRHLWDRSIISRDDAAASLSLQNQEQFLWTSSNGEFHTKHSTVVSMVVVSKQDQLIIDMDKFKFELLSVNCTENMMMQFRHDWSYQAAVKSWEWVNFNGIRSFVMVTDYKGCGADKSRDPWVVSNIRYSPSNRTVYLDGVKKTWKDVSNSYTLDFGDFDPTPGASAVDKRFLDVSLNKAFTLDLSSTFPSDIVNWTSPEANLAITCDNCGTKGTLVFAGHIEASLFGGIETFVISATPHGIEANVNLNVSFEGEVDFSGAIPLQKDVTLLTLPVGPGWTIPHILTFGPNIQINAGMSLDYIIGRATVSTGISAQIPDSSVAKVDLQSKKAVQISGWIPNIVTQPLHVDAEVDAQVELYTEVAVGVSLIVLDEDGINVDIGLRIPDLTITASTGFNTDGFCPNSTEQYGVKIDASLGADLLLEGWDEVNGDKDVFLSVHLFDDPDVYTFPEVCFGFDFATPGSCIFVPDSGEEEVYAEIEIESGLNKRNALLMPQIYSRGLDERSRLMPRAPNRKRGYTLACDSGKTQIIYVQTYPTGPTARNRDTSRLLPIMEPQIPCGETVCPPALWETIESSNPSIVTSQWAAEHIYEGNWVIHFLNYLNDNYFTTTTPDVCNGLIGIFGNGPITLATPDPAGPSNYSEAIMQNLGTVNTFLTLMALLPQKQNGLKNLMFEPGEIDASITKSATNNNDRTCSIGRIITTCKYLNNDKILSRLKDTITAVESVLEVMDNDPTVQATTPAALKTKTYKAAHAEFFNNFYTTGINHTRSKLVEYANFVIGTPNFGDLSADLQAAMHNVSSNPEIFCPSDYAHP